MRSSPSLVGAQLRMEPHPMYCWRQKSKNTHVQIVPPSFYGMSRLRSCAWVIWTKIPVAAIPVVHWPMWPYIKMCNVSSNSALLAMAHSCVAVAIPVFTQMWQVLCLGLPIFWLSTREKLHFFTNVGQIKQ